MKKLLAALRFRAAGKGNSKLTKRRASYGALFASLKSRVAGREQPARPKKAQDPPDQQPAQEVVMAGAGDSSGPSSSFSGVSSDYRWTCGTCTFVNENPDWLACSLCAAERD